MGINKAEKAVGSFAGEMGVTKAEQAAGSFSGEMGITKATLGKKEAAGTGEKAKEEREAEPVVDLVTKERVSDSHIARIKARPLRKIPPLDEIAFSNNPSRRERIQACLDHINYLVDMEQDCLRQSEEKGYAEIGVKFISGVKKVFILPRQES